MNPIRKKWREKLGLKTKAAYRILRSPVLLQQLESCASESDAFLLMRMRNAPAPSVYGLRQSRTRPAIDRLGGERFARIFASIAANISGDHHFIEVINGRWTVYRDDYSGKEIVVL